jgi:hypothetical protein
MDLTSNVNKLKLFFTSVNATQCSRNGISIKSFTVNITGYYRFHGRVAGHTLCYFRVTNREGRETLS